MGLARQQDAFDSVCLSLGTKGDQQGGPRNSQASAVRVRFRARKAGLVFGAQRQGKNAAFAKVSMKLAAELFLARLKQRSREEHRRASFLQFERSGRVGNGQG